jgi:hypothetical protein
MELASIINQYYVSFMTKHSDTLLPGHLKALNAIRRCRTPDSGEVFTLCNQCGHSQWNPMSCGHRSCPKCQNHETSRWIDRQQDKLLPSPYFMVTFTLPYTFRPLLFYHQKEIYPFLFSCAASTLSDFASNPENLGVKVGMSIVLHTHNRKLDYHPHVHVLIPGGGVDEHSKQWKNKQGKYLFNKKAMAKVFRARVLDELSNAGISIPHNAPPKWVADCKYVGTGITALKYLARYLYRGVISEKNITSNHDGKITFKYIDSQTKKAQYRTINGEDFLKLILQHVLPKGFRRVRDYGFLHSNAKKLLCLVQVVLRVVIEKTLQRPRPVFKCSRCKSQMAIITFRKPICDPG